MQRSKGLPKKIKTLVGKVVVITGASSGVGRAAALEFASHGARLVIAARRIDVLEEVAAECAVMGCEVLTVQTDVTDALAVKRLAKAAFDFGGRIDVWVNNAGVLGAGGFTDTPIEVHDQVIKTNLMGYIHGAYAALPFFKSQRAGILINNISIGGFYPTPYAVGYSASKFGLKGFSDALKGELIKWPDIHVCDLFPAFLDTPGIKHAANYTGKVLKPAPPVYDPVKVARAMTRVALQPRKSLTIGGIAYVLHAGYTLMPAFMRFATARVMETYFKQAEPAPLSSGNVFEPLESGKGIHGDKKKNSSNNKARKITLITAGFFAAVLLTRKIIP